MQTIRILSKSYLFLRSTLRTFKASFIGINRFNPSDDDDAYFATAIPTTSPELLNKGPPLFPGEIAASD